jgi:hypothetical protein
MFISKQEKVGMLSRISTLEAMVKSLYAERRAEKEKTVEEPELDPFDTLESLFPPRKKRSKSITPYGTLGQYAYPFVETLEVGQKVEIPPKDKFTIERLQRSLTSHLQQKYGKKSYQTRMSLLTGNLEVVRIS